MSVLIKNAAEHWEFVSPLLRKPKNEDDYDTLVQALDELLEMTGVDESHPLMSLVDIIGDWIEEWDHKHHPMPEATGAEVLGYMMREHGLTQSDLPGVGTSVGRLRDPERQAPAQPAADPLVGRALQCAGRRLYLTRLTTNN